MFGGVIINCSFINVDLTRSDGEGVCVKNLTFDSKTQDYLDTIDLIDCKIWKSDQWVNVPDEYEAVDFFNI